LSTKEKGKKMETKMIEIKIQDKRISFSVSSLPLKIEIEGVVITASLSESQDNSETVVDNSETDLKELNEWWKSGQLWRQCHRINGVLEGEFKMWHENGQLYRHCYYKNGRLDGEFKTWNEDGELSQHELWKNGNCQEFAVNS